MLLCVCCNMAMLVSKRPLSTDRELVMVIDKKMRADVCWFVCLSSRIRRHNCGVTLMSCERATWKIYQPSTPLTFFSKKIFFFFCVAGILIEKIAHFVACELSRLWSLKLDFFFFHKFWVKILLREFGEVKEFFEVFYWTNLL